MTKVEIQTNLIGRRVRVTMGVDMGDGEEVARVCGWLGLSGPPSAVWSLFGERGLIVGAYLNEDREPIFLVEVDGTVEKVSTNLFELMGD